MVVVHYSPIFRKYDNYGSLLPVCITPLVYLICLVAAFLIAFFSGDFYKQYGYYAEQPRSSFLQKSILILHTNSGPRIWTSSDHINSQIIPPSQLIHPQFSIWYQQNTGLSRQIQFIRNVATPSPDAKVDRFRLQFKVPLDSTIIYGVDFLTNFLIKLDKNKRIDMHSAAFIQAKTPISSSRLDVMGEMQLRQRTPFNQYHSSTAFNYTTLDFSEVLSLRELDPTEIMRDFHSREETAIFSQDYTYWVSGSGVSQFEFNIDVSFPEWNIAYKPGFWESIKQAYVQWVAILLPLLILGWLFLQIIYSGGILNTRLMEVIKLKRS